MIVNHCTLAEIFIRGGGPGAWGPPPPRKSNFEISILGAPRAQGRCPGVLASVSEPVWALILPLDGYSEADLTVRQSWGKDERFNFNGIAVRIGLLIVL